MVKLARVGCNGISLLFQPIAGNSIATTWHDQDNRKTLPDMCLEAAKEGRKVASLIRRIGGIAGVTVLLEHVFQRGGTVVVEEGAAVRKAPEAGRIELFDSLRISKAHVVHVGPGVSTAEHGSWRSRGAQRPAAALDGSRVGVPRRSSSGGGSSSVFK